MSQPSDSGAQSVLNRPWILFHLHEALEELQGTIAEIERDDYTSSEFAIAMQHLYHHLNTAWNSRAADDERTAEGNGRDFDSWRQFPTDLLLW